MWWDSNCQMPGDKVQRCGASISQEGKGQWNNTAHNLRASLDLPTEVLFAEPSASWAELAFVLHGPSRISTSNRICQSLAKELLLQLSDTAVHHDSLDSSRHGSLLWKKQERRRTELAVVEFSSASLWHVCYVCSHDLPWQWLASDCDWNNSFATLYRLLMRHENI